MDSILRRVLLICFYDYWLIQGFLERKSLHGGILREYSNFWVEWTIFYSYYLRTTINVYKLNPYLGFAATRRFSNGQAGFFFLTR